MAAAACALALCGAAPSAAEAGCAYSRCAEFRLIPPPKLQRHSARKQRRSCSAPPGWGWRRRQKYRHDCSQPLAVFDELGGIVVLHRNW